MMRLALHDAKVYADITTCGSVKEAVLLVRDSTECIADFIVLDLSLLDGSGLDVLTAVRSNMHTRFIPVIVLSGSTRDEDVKLAYALGANAYMVKPTDFAEQVDAVKAMRAFWFDTARLPS